MSDPATFRPMTDEEQRALRDDPSPKAKQARDLIALCRALPEKGAMTLACCAVDEWRKARAKEPTP